MKTSFRPLAARRIARHLRAYFADALAASPISQDWMGSPVKEGRVDRVVDIGPSTRFVNVDENQIVKFVVHAASGRDEAFTWQFNGARSVIPLSEIAPPGVVAQPVNVYVGPDPLAGDQAD